MPVSPRDPQNGLTPCPLCRRPCPATILENHHLKTRKRDAKAVKQICRECHKTIHGLFANPELRDPRLDLDSVEGLLRNSQFARALTFISKVPPGNHMRMRQSARRRR